MIKVRNIETWGFEHAVRGMRNPFNSWDRSDSHYVAEGEHYDRIKYEIGEKDLELMRSLYAGGPEHRKYMRQIFVSMDILAPLYWWKQADQFKVGTTTNSCSTMHKIADKEFTLDDFSHEHLMNGAQAILKDTIGIMNFYRAKYLESKDKALWWQLIQLLPSSYNQKRTLTMNYENVVTIIKQRAGHKLNEWNYFTAVLFDLPYVKDIIGNDEDIYDD